MTTKQSQGKGKSVFQCTERLTVSEVQATEGFEHLTDQEAEQYINDLEQFCRIICLVLLKNTDANHENRKAA